MRPISFEAGKCIVNIIEPEGDGDGERVTVLDGEHFITMTVDEAHDLALALIEAVKTITDCDPDLSLVGYSPTVDY